MPYVTSVERIGIKKGRQEGAQQQALKSIIRILERRFETVSVTVQRRLQGLTTEQLELLIDTALSVESLKAFSAQLPKVSRPRQQAAQGTQTARSRAKRKVQSKSE